MRNKWIARAGWIVSLAPVFICLTSVGFPGLNGFVGEMLILAGTYTMQAGVSNNALVCIIACVIFLGGWYLFTMLKNVFFGQLHEPHHEGHEIHDLNGRELAAIVPVAIACIVLGLYPQPVLDSARRDVNTVVKISDAARDREQDP